VKQLAGWEMLRACREQQRGASGDAAKPPFNRLTAQAALTQLAYYDASGSRIVALPETAAPAAGALLKTAVVEKKSASGIERDGGEPAVTLVQPITLIDRSLVWLIDVAATV